MVNGIVHNCLNISTCHSTRTHYSYSEPISLSGEAPNTNFIIFGLTRLGLEPTIYRNRSENANNYATDAVSGLTRLFNHMQSCRCFQLSTDVTRNIPSYFIITFTVRQVMRGLDFSSRGKNLYDRIISLIEKV